MAAAASDCNDGSEVVGAVIGGAAQSSTTRGANTLEEVGEVKPLVLSPLVVLAVCAQRRARVKAAL